MGRKNIILMVILMLLIAACVPNAGDGTTTQEDVSIPGQPAESLPECPPTAIPAIFECPTQTQAESQPSVLRIAKISSANLTLRSGPSPAHAVLGSYPIDTEVTILGKAPGGGWVVVSPPDGRLGWMYTLYLDVEITDRLEEVPVVTPTESWSIDGEVVDDLDQPISSVRVKLSLGDRVDSSIFTDEEGQFVLFAPMSQSGPWMVSIEGVGCMSWVASSDCLLEGFVLRNPSNEYSIGQEDSLRFIYEATSLLLIGQVQDGEGRVQPTANVFATRDDGAYVTSRTDSGGVFQIPITPGTWRLRAKSGSVVTIDVGPDGYKDELILLSQSQ